MSTQVSFMLKNLLLRSMAVASLGALIACSSTPYTPVTSQSNAIDLSSYVQKADTFVVLLDASGSMNNDDSGRPRIYDAQDWTASFNNTVPPLMFQSAIITFGKGATGTCMGYGVASRLYGPVAYDKAEFASALGSIECAASTTPIVDALSLNADLLAPKEGAGVVNDPGQIAVIIVSDFNWDDPDAVADSLTRLRKEHPGRLCLHTVKIGNETEHNAMIGSLTDAGSCDSAIAATDAAAGEALTNYVASTLLSKVEYETHSVSASALFDFDKAILKESGRQELARLDQIIKSKGLAVKDIDLVGYTDSMGTEAYNQRLSERRAQAVYQYLISRGIDGSIIDVLGRGELDPVASNETEKGRALNRRVEIHVGTVR